MIRLARPARIANVLAMHVMDFCKIDLDSDGMVSMEEYLNKGNPLSG
jgi:hypothetical protein